MPIFTVLLYTGTKKALSPPHRPIDYLSLRYLQNKALTMPVEEGRVTYEDLAELEKDFDIVELEIRNLTPFPRFLTIWYFVRGATLLK